MFCPIRNIGYSSCSNRNLQQRFVRIEHDANICPALQYLLVQYGERGEVAGSSAQAENGRGGGGVPTHISHIFNKYDLSPGVVPV